MKMIPSAAALRTKRVSFVAVHCMLAMAASASAQSDTLVSLSTTGQQGNAWSGNPVCSADGRVVAFSSDASNLVPLDTNGVGDVFVRDLQTGMTERVSVSSSGAQADEWSDCCSISADGRYVVFVSHATNLVPGDTNGAYDLFVRDRQNGTTERVSVGSNGVQANADVIMQTICSAISADGRYVAFASFATNLVPGDTNGAIDVFVRDRQNGTTERVSVSSTGEQGNDGGNDAVCISPDGRYVAFCSLASNLVPGDTNNAYDIFVHDRQTGTTEIVSGDASGFHFNDHSGATGISMSADGRYVAFSSHTPDPWSPAQIFVHDRATGATRCASVSDAGVVGTGDAFYCSISSDGRYVTFQSQADNLVPYDHHTSDDVFVRDCLAGTTEGISVTLAMPTPNGASARPYISADGRHVVFVSAASNLAAADTNAQTDVLLHDRAVSPPYSFCFGDGSDSACPCGNSGAPGHGCQNSAGTGGAVLTASGSASLSADTLVLTSSNELASAFSVPSQGTQAINALAFGDGLRCVGGALKRLYGKSAVNGVVTVPQAGDPSISARSAALGDVIPIGATRFYYTYYRDPSPTFCADPIGKTWNVTNSLAIVWTP